MRGYPIIFGEGVDPDAYQYFLRAGIASGTQTPTAYVTNLIPWSQSFAQWTPLQNIAVSTTSATTDPLGGTTANLITENTTTGVHRVFGVPPTTLGIVYTFSIYAKLATGTRWLRLNFDAAMGAAAVFNLSAGTFVTEMGTATMTNVGNGWFRCSVTGAAKATQALNPVYPSLHNGTSDVYAGDGTSSLYWWGAQFETGSTASVYVPTTSTAVTQAVAFADSRRLISDFVRGIKSLGLWNQMVCWPLRSSQNASTTLTARSLGGLGTFDGTLVGLASSSWLSNGLNMPNNTGFITFPSMSDFSSGITAGSVHSINVFPSPNRGLSFEGLSPIGQGGLWSPFSDGLIYWDCLDASLGRLSVASGAAANTYYMWSGSSNGASIYLNASRLATGGVTGGLSNTFNIQFGRAGGTLVFNGNASFVFILRNGLTQSQVASFYSQYRSTLGLGLALP